MAGSSHLIPRRRGRSSKERFDLPQAISGKAECKRGQGAGSKDARHAFAGGCGKGKNGRNVLSTDSANEGGLEKSLRGKRRKESEEERPSKGKMS